MVRREHVQRVSLVGDEDVAELRHRVVLDGHRPLGHGEPLALDEVLVCPDEEAGDAEEHDDDRDGDGQQDSGSTHGHGVASPFQARLN
ncbi:hypothetical protein Athai_06280 [Actinocatenispora thailandica]|uniref:Uncharacterized protein n=1 Tax=Actinocatenispora thailandica TaxID=227318 RepID=A0A7R7DKC7_9ACTN|nr:hypothetical protein [Actinocatenispora thailandica]BCJ33125.1 hypothetical protein Athai_06280 [Actinocatenispora thailandica]